MASDEEGDRDPHTALFPWASHVIKQYQEVALTGKIEL